MQNLIQEHNNKIKVYSKGVVRVSIMNLQNEIIDIFSISNLISHLY